MATTATQDFKDKMRFESLLNAELTGYFNRVANTFMFRARNNLPFNAGESLQDELAAILLKHYKRVEVPFSNRIRPTLPREVVSTVEEDATITRTLNQFNVIRSELQAKNINRTTAKNIEEALTQARSFDTDKDRLEDGRVVSKKALVGFELILTAGSILKRLLRGRLPSIVNTETQVPAEVAKLTEAEVLVGLMPSIFGGDRKQVPVAKFWVTQGDSIVRPSHLVVDGQERPFNVPFTVGGFPLKVPGDSSLGAPLKEIINCRCAAEFSTEEIAAFRFDKLREETFIVRG